MSLFKNYKMTDATVDNPDYSEAELVTVEPTEDASKEENDLVEFDPGTEARMILQMHNRKMSALKKDVARRINKLAKLHRALRKEGKISPVLRTILLEEEIVDTTVIDDSAKDDVDNMTEDYTDVSEKSATEKELVEASMKAQHRVLMSLYKKLN